MLRPQTIHGRTGKMRSLDEILDDIKENPKPLDQALESLTPKERKEYEEAIELWITYGGD